MPISLPAVAKRLKLRRRGAHAAVAQSELAEAPAGPAGVADADGPNRRRRASRLPARCSDRRERARRSDPSSRSRSRQTSAARPLPMLPRLICTPDRRKRTVRRPGSSSTNGCQPARRLGQLGLLRKPARPACKSPRLPKRRRSNVISAARVGADLHRQREQIEQVGIHLDAAVGRQPVESRDFAHRPEIGQRLFQRFDPIERLDARLACRPRTGPPEGKPRNGRPWPTATRGSRGHRSRDP